MTSTVRAVEIRSAGSSPEPADRPRPVPRAGEVLVDVLAAPITPLDVLCASGTSYFGMPQMPYVPGVQGVGRVEGATVWFPTTAGMGPGDGSMATTAVAARADLVVLPDGADPVLVAALGLSAVAAHMALTWRGELQPGERVIVLGAGGVVGQAAIQLARVAGAAHVVAGVRSPAAAERALRAGADAVVETGSDDVAGIAARLRAAAGGSADLVLDPVFGVPAAAALRALRPGGRLVNLGSSAAETSPIDSSTLRSRSLRVLGYTNNELTAEQRSSALVVVARLAARGELTVAHETAALDDATAAWRRHRAGAAEGRIVLVPPS